MKLTAILSREKAIDMVLVVNSSKEIFALLLYFSITDDKKFSRIYWIVKSLKNFEVLV
mgnify:CR=1 FL=1